MGRINWQNGPGRFRHTKQPITYDVQPVDETPKQDTPEKHLPLNPDGTYGGNRDATLYTPIRSGRGLWDHVDSNYYKINDFYNMGSEGSRILLPNYTVLQQTTGDTCGQCALSSVLKYYGDERSYYDLELITLNTYEQVTGKVVKGNGSNAKGLAATVEHMGYKADYTYTPIEDEPPFTTYEAYKEFMRSNLEAGRPVVVSYKPSGGHFLTVIGLDDMGTDYIYDDVLIIADSFDCWDGYQDGYNIYSAYKFFSQHTNKKHTRWQSYVVVYKNES